MTVGSMTVEATVIMALPATIAKGVMAEHMGIAAAMVRVIVRTTEMDTGIVDVLMEVEMEVEMGVVERAVSFDGLYVRC